MMVDFGKPTMAMVLSLYEQQIYVRPGGIWGMPTFMRISIGTRADNETFLNAVRELSNS
jgi:histidinol-phosphate aminotransferase